MVWKGSEAAGNQCEQSSEEAWKIKENPYTKREERIRRKSKRSKKIGKSVEMERVAERKVATGQGRWLGYSSWRQT
tara:strand:+ start:44 stop:271 length:228 start_codon:yes stop_codon:yes gene_type:complete